MNEIFEGYMLGGIVLHAILSIIVGILGADRETGFFGAFLISILFTPFVGVICVMSTPTKDEVDRRRAMYRLLKELHEKHVLPSAG